MLLREYDQRFQVPGLMNAEDGLEVAGENPKGNKEIWESRERCRLLSLRNELLTRT